MGPEPAAWGYHVAKRLALRGLDLGGRLWYPRAEATVRDLARATGAPPGDAAAVVAITSPLRTVADNLRLARAILLLPDPRDLSGLGRGLPPSTAQALANYWATGKIGGPKVSAFARALHDPSRTPPGGDPQAVVLDRHMARVFTGRASLTRREYDFLANRVRALAARLGETPRDVQAAIWLAQRERTGLTPVWL